MFVTYNTHCFELIFIFFDEFIYFLSFENRFGQFWQKQISSRNIYISILKCTRWPQIPYNICKEYCFLTVCQLYIQYLSISYSMQWVYIVYCVRYQCQILLQLLPISKRCQGHYYSTYHER